MAQLKREVLPLHSAVEHKVLPKIKMLLPLKDVNERNDKGYTVFLLACEHTDNEVLDLILTHKKDIDTYIKTKEGFSALHILAFRGNLQGMMNVIDAFPEVDIDAVSNKGSTPLIEACKMNHIHVMKYLLEKGANVNHQNNEKRYSALFYAATYGFAECAELLLQYGANVEVKCGYHLTPLMKAAQWGFLEVCQVLYKHGANLNASRGNASPLTSSCSYDKVEVTKFLILHGADVHFPGPYSTALIECAKRGSVRCAEELINAGVDIHGETHNGKTALDFARENGHDEMVRLLLSHSE